MSAVVLSSSGLDAVNIIFRIFPVWLSFSTDLKMRFAFNKNPIIEWSIHDEKFRLIYTAQWF